MLHPQPCHTRLSLTLESFDVAAWIQNHTVDSDKTKTNGTGSDLKVAGANGSGQKDDGIGVMISMDKDEATRRQERDAQAELKRQQNALPAWHLKSTITGDLTALGVKESAREAAAAGAEQMTNDDILKGLGVIGGGNSRANNQTNLRITTSMAEDIKPVVNAEADCKCGSLLRKGKTLISLLRL